MTDPIEKPHRAFELTIRIGADSFENLMSEVDSAFAHTRKLRENCNMVSGGINAGVSIYLETDESMTTKRYHEELERYLSYQKANPQS